MYVAIYLSIMVIVAFLGFAESDEEEGVALRRKYIIYGIIVLLLTFLAGLRPIGIDNDGEAYVRYFNGLIDYDFEVELSFDMIAAISKFISDSPVVLFLIYALLAIPLKGFAITRLTKFVFVSLMVWMSNFFILQDVTQIRAAVATASFLMGLHFYLKKQWPVFLLFVAVSIFFHTSAVLFLMVLFFSNKPLSNMARWILAVPPIIGMAMALMKVDLVVALPIDYVQNKVEIYEELRDTGVMGDEINVLNIVFLLRIMTYYFLLWKYKVVEEQGKYVSLFLKLYMFSLFFFTALAFFPVAAFRVSEMFGVVEIVLLPCVIYAFEQKFAGKLFITIYAFAYVIYNIFVGELLDLTM